MATVNQRLAFLISANADSAIRAFEKTATSAEKQMGKTEKSLQRTGATMTRFGAAGLAAAGTLGAGLFKAGQSAGDLSESLNKTRVVFGQTSTEIVKFSETAAKELGLSQRAALDAASTFATFGKAAELSGAELNTFSKDLVNLSADLASFYNTSPEDAIIAIGAALRGESEPIRRYGVLLNDATLKQRALEMGIYDGTGVLTSQQKVLAAQREILAQTSDAQGDFARTSEGLANQQRILTANIENAKAALGEAFIPVIQTGIGIVGGAVGVFNNFNETTDGMGSQLATVGTVGLGAVSTMSLLTGQAIKMRDRFFNINQETGKLAGGLTAAGKATFATAGIVSAATLIYSIYSSKKKEATERTKNLTDALKLEGDEQRKALASLVENDKATGNFVDSLNLLGVSLGDVQNEVNGYSTQFNDVRAALEIFEARQGSGQVAVDQFAEAIGYAGELTKAQVFRLADMIEQIDLMRDAQDKATAAQRRANEALGMGALATKTKAQIENEEISKLKVVKDETNKNSDAQDKLRQKVEKAADALRNKMNTALDAARDNLKKATQEFDDYQKQIATAITDTIGFSTAFGKLQENVQSVADGKQALADADKRVAEANKDVLDAEKNLASVMRDPSSDPKEIARANDQVADAKDRAAEATREQAKAAKDLADAQGRPQTFLGSLQAQQVQAQTFATNLQKLVDLGLSQNAIDQIASIGAEAGNAIATEILTSANPAQYISQVNGIIAGMQVIANQVGLSAAEKFKKAGVDAATALVSGMQSILSQYEIKLNWKSLGKSKRPIKTIGDLQRAFTEQMTAQFALAQVAVPEMADGGIVKARSGGTLVRLGEGGQDEAVLPLPAPSKMGGDTITNLTINVQGGDPRAIVDALQTYMSRYGAVPIRTVAP
jgi:hypothetical protein